MMQRILVSIKVPCLALTDTKRIQVPRTILAKIVSVVGILTEMRTQHYVGIAEGISKMTDKRLIFLAPGWGKFDIGWYFLKKRFIADGFDVIYAPYPQNGFGSIEDSAKQTARVLEVIKDSYDHITFVGHSMGGLVGRYIVEAMGRTDLFHAYASMGTPHQGTLLGFLGWWSTSAGEMKVHSDFYKKLVLPWPEEIPRLSISAGLDWIVLPHSSSDLKGATQVHIPRATHSTLLVHPRIYQEIYAWLIYSIFDEVGFVSKEGFFARFSPKNHVYGLKISIILNKMQEICSKLPFLAKKA